MNRTEALAALNKLADIWDDKSFDPMSTRAYKLCAADLRVTIKPLLQSEAEPVGEALYSEGICGDGAAILKDGVMMPIEDVITELNRCAKGR